MEKLPVLRNSSTLQPLTPNALPLTFLSDDFIPLNQTRWTDADPIQKPQGPHQEDRLQGALLFPATEGRDHGRSEGSGRSLSLESAGKLDILHQRYIGEASHLFEERATHEQSLIAGGEAAQSRTPVHGFADDGPPHRWAIESDIEPSAHYPSIGQCCVDHYVGIAWKLGVGMEKQ